jgi:hypothetical protein
MSRHVSNKARDIYDHGMFSTRPLNQALIRRIEKQILQLSHRSCD